MRKELYSIKKTDAIIIGAVLLAALLWLAVLAWRDTDNTQVLYAEIYLDGQLLHNIVLTAQEQELHIQCANGYNILQYGRQGLRIMEADCHNQDCVQAGWHYRAGDLIVCLPHRLLIQLSGDKGAEFDAISR